MDTIVVGVSICDADEVEEMEVEEEELDKEIGVKGESNGRGETGPSTEANFNPSLLR